MDAKPGVGTSGSSDSVSASGCHAGIPPAAAVVPVAAAAAATLRAEAAAEEAERLLSDKPPTAFTPFPPRVQRGARRELRVGAAALPPTTEQRTARSAGRGAATAADILTAAEAISKARL